jgi:imidazole glycerol-phosphate synthase subunit HisH
MKTLLIDYGAGNLRSAAKALLTAGFDLTVSSDPRAVEHSDAIVLPGQGHFRQVMEAFVASGFEHGVRDHLARGKPFLGICVGLQILFTGSEEAPEQPGLGILPGFLRRFAGSGLPVPQMQWNQLQPFGNSPLLAGIDSQAFAYFVHSYFVPFDENSTKHIQHGATSDYGVPFLSVLSRDNIHGTQFHPEKSQATGLQILQNFHGAIRGELS